MQGTAQVIDLNPGFGSSNPWPLAGFNGQLLFSATDGTQRSLWMTDGTAGGAHRLMDDGLVNDGAMASGGKLFIVTGGKLFVSDGTAEGTTAIHSYGNNAPDYAPFHDGVAFSGDDMYGQRRTLVQRRHAGRHRDARGRRHVTVRNLERPRGVPEPVPLGDRALFAGGDAAAFPSGSPTARGPGP